MKRIFAAIIAFAIVVSGSSMVFADEVDNQKLKAKAETFLAEEHYDFKKGSVEVKDVEPITVNDPEGNVSEVWAAFVSYDTLRDNIFFFKHTEVIYFDVVNDQMLSAMDAGKFEALTDYKDQFDGEVGKKMSKLPILLLLSLLLIIPGYLMFVWVKQSYSTTAFKVKNNIFNQTQTFN